MGMHPFIDVWISGVDEQNWGTVTILWRCLNWYCLSSLKFISVSNITKKLLKVMIKDYRCETLNLSLSTDVAWLALSSISGFVSDSQHLQFAFDFHEYILVQFHNVI